jgi:hypothetical protein
VSAVCGIATVGVTPNAWFCFPACSFFFNNRSLVCPAHRGTPTLSRVQCTVLQVLISRRLVLYTLSVTWLVLGQSAIGM